MLKKMSDKDAFELLDKGSLQELERALEQGLIDVNLAEKSYGKTLLMHAAMFRSDAVDILIERGARLEDRDKDGNTALILAAECDSSGARSVEKLVKAGACVNARNDFGNSPLALAVICNMHSAVPILLDAGADVNVRDMHGYVSSTPIALVYEYTFAEDRAPLIRMLVAAGSKHLPNTEETKRAVESLEHEFIGLAAGAENDLRKLELDVRNIPISRGRPFFERMLMSMAREKALSNDEPEGLAKMMSSARGEDGEVDRESVFYKAVVEYIDDYMDKEAGRTILEEIERMSAEMAESSSKSRTSVKNAKNTQEEECFTDGKAPSD